MNPAAIKSHLPINWQDGMMINADHLKGINQYINAAHHNNSLIQTNPINYGLLPCHDKNYQSLEIRSETPRTYFAVELIRCMAIMPSATIVFINPDTIAQEKYNATDLRIEINLNDTYERYLLIYLQINPEQKAVGQFDKNETFDRKPYLNHTAQLKYTTLNDPSEITDRYRNAPNVLPLSLFDARDKSHPTPIKQFIPPCISFNAHQPLAELYNKLKTKTEAILESTCEVMKFVHEDSLKKFRADIAINMGIILPPIINTLIQINSRFKTDLIYQNPIQLIKEFKQLSISIRAAYFTLNPTRRRELERYFADFHATPADFMEVADKVESAEYEHSNIYHSTIHKILRLLKVYGDLFAEMSKKGLKTTEFQPGTTYHEDIQTPVPTPPPIPPKPQPQPKNDEWDMLN